MRVSTAIVLAFIAVPAVAADSIADQAHAAFATFAGGLAQTDYNTAGYGGVALRGIAGQWVSLAGPAAATGIETYGADTERACKSAAALTLASTNSITLTLSAKPADIAFSQIFTLVAGSTFSEYTNPEAYFAAIGLGPDRQGLTFDQSRAVALSVANGTVQIYRPSDDILVITRDKAYPTVLARCPR